MIQRLALGAMLLLVSSLPASAQQVPPSIGRFVVDFRATFPPFPDNAQLAASRGISQTDLPGLGLGVDVGGHFYFYRWRAMTFGVGGELMIGRATSSPQGTTGQAVTERFTSLAPQISFNFGGGTGWSYISAGIGHSVWSVVPAGAAELPADQEHLYTINYGGGARWFAKKHLAFSLDFRWYAVNPGTPNGDLPSSPRMTMLVLGAGVSVR